LAKKQQQNLWNTVIGFVGAGLGFVNQVVLMGRFFSPEELGLTRILFQAATLYAQFIVFGGNNLTIRFFPHFKDQSKGLAKLFQIGWMVVAIGLLASSLVAWIFQDSILGVYVERSPMFVSYALWTVPMAIGFALFQWLGSWTHVFQKSVFESRLKEIWLRLLITGVISLYLFAGVDWDTFVLSYSFIPLIVSIPLVVFAYRQDVFRSFQNISLQEFKPYLNFSFYNVLSRTSGFITLTIDVLIIGSLVGLKGVAVYSMGTYLVSFVVIPSRALQKVAFPKVAHYWSQSDLPSIQRLYSNTASGLLFWSGSLFVGGYLFAPILVVYLGDEYQLLTPVFLAFGLGRMAEMITSINRGILRNSSLFRFETLFTVLFAISMIALDLVLIPLFGKETAINGIVGAAWGSAISIFVFNTCVSGLLYYRFKLKPFAPKQLALVVWLLVLALVLPQIQIFSESLVNSIFQCALFLVLTAVFFWFWYKKSDNRKWLSLND